MFVVLFVFVFLVYVFYFFCLFCVPLPSWSGDHDGDHVLRRLLSCPFSSAVCFPERVPGFIWFGSVYLVTTAGGFVADQLIM